MAVTGGLRRAAVTHELTQLRINATDQLGADTMNKFDSTPLRTRIAPTREGWSVHIYDRNRRLLCALEPSHAWLFLGGCAVGVLLAIGWVNLAQGSHAVERTTPQTTPLLQVD